MDDDLVQHNNLTSQEREWRRERALWNLFVLQKMQQRAEDVESQFVDGDGTYRTYPTVLEFWRQMII